MKVDATVGTQAVVQFVESTDDGNDKYHNFTLTVTGRIIQSGPIVLLTTFTFDIFVTANLLFLSNLKISFTRIHYETPFTITFFTSMVQI